MDGGPGTQFCWAGNRGALTTTFTPPSTCLGTTSVYFVGLEVPPAQQIVFYYIGFWSAAAPDDLRIETFTDPCMPPAATPVNVGPWYYSPGICPSAYTPAVQLLTLPNICNSEAALPESVTAWVCCPPGYFATSAVTNKDWTMSSVCVSTASGAATLTSVWPISYVSAATDFQFSSVWPISAPSGIIQPFTVITNPTVIAEGMPIMWESTDTQVVSWFAQHQGAGGPVTTGPRPTQSVATAGPTNTQTSSASGRVRGNKLSVGAWGALFLVAIIIISS